MSNRVSSQEKRDNLKQSIRQLLLQVQYGNVTQQENYGGLFQTASGIDFDVRHNESLWFLFANSDDLNQLRSQFTETSTFDESDKLNAYLKLFDEIHKKNLNITDVIPNVMSYIMPILESFKSEEKSKTYYNQLLNHLPSMIGDSSEIYQIETILLAEDFKKVLQNLSIPISQMIITTGDIFLLNYLSLEERQDIVIDIIDPDRLDKFIKSLDDIAEIINEFSMEEIKALFSKK